MNRHTVVAVVKLFIQGGVAASLLLATNGVKDGCYDTAKKSRICCKCFRARKVSSAGDVDCE